MGVSADTIRAVIDEVEELDLPDGAHWAMCAERLGMDIADFWMVYPLDVQKEANSDEEE